MLMALVLTALLAEASPAPQPAASERSDPPTASAPAQEKPVLNSKKAGGAGQSAPQREEAPINKKVDNPVMPPLPDGTAGSQVLDPGKSPVEPHRDVLPNELSDVPLAPTGPAPPSSTPQQESHTGKTGGGANRVDSIR
jgi:hypothetical protein